MKNRTTSVFHTGGGGKPASVADNQCFLFFKNFSVFGCKYKIEKFLAGFSCTFSESFIKIPAFTMAEVLITLGIIGIVASMTMPGLMGAYRKKVVETQLQKAFSTLAQVIQRAEVDHGEARYWDYPSEGAGSTEAGDSGTHAFTDNYIKPYLNIVYTTPHEKKFDVYWSSGVKSWYDQYIWHTPGFVLPSGAILYFFPLKEGDNVRTNILVVTSNSNDKFILGKNMFLFNLYSDTKTPARLGIQPRPDYKWTCGDLEKNRDEFISECKQDTGGSAHGVSSASWCTFLIYCNGWTVPKDYPIKF